MKHAETGQADESIKSIDRVLEIEEADSNDIDFRVTIAMFNAAYERWQKRRMREGTLTVPPMTGWKDAMWRSCNAAKIMKENKAQD